MAAAAQPRMSLPPIDTVMSPICAGCSAMKRSAADAWVCPGYDMPSGPGAVSAHPFCWRTVAVVAPSQAKFRRVKSYPLALARPTTW